MDNKYYESYRRFTTQWEYADQEKYSELEVALENLESKEIIDDEAYNAEVSRLESLNDFEALETYRNDYVSESEYHFTREELLEEMKKMQEYYRVTAEQLAEDKKIRAMYSRDRLRLIKRSYESRGNFNIMRDLNVDSLSDDEAIEMYRNVRHGISAEMDMEIGNRAIWDRVGHRTKGGTGNVDPVEKTDKEKIEELIAKFKIGVERITREFNETQFKLTLGDINSLNVTDAIRGLEDELRELFEEASALIAEMDAFRLSAEEAEFSMSVAEVKATIKGFKDRLKKLKQLQIDKYNARVEIVNRMIIELKGSEGLNPEVLAVIQGLELIPICDVKVGEWRNFKYIQYIDYTKLIEINNIIVEIKQVKEETVSLEADILWIEKRISELEKLIKPGMSEQDKVNFGMDIVVLADRINHFGVKLNHSLGKDSNLSNITFEDYEDRINDAQINLADLNTRLSSIGQEIIPPVEISMYSVLNEKLSALQIEINDFTNLIDSLFGKVSVTALPVFEIRISSFESRLEAIKTEIETNKDKLDENQYSELMKKVEKMEQQLRAVREKIRDPKMVQEVVIKEMDIFDVLNGQIDGLEAAVDKLEAQIDALEKPIKDKNTRKMIDRELIRLEEEAKLIETLLEKYKEENPEKYQAAKERLDNIKDRIEKIGKKYRKKCPLIIRGVKEAKNFYKKHKKLCLIIAGLAAVALLHATVGPVLIPAIMHGNIMMAYKVPFLRGIVGFVNNILGNMVGAKVVAGGLWQLANGTLLSVSGASASLLKGLAISGIGSTALIAPVVIAIKKLIEKMKKDELKKKHGEEVEVVEEKEKKEKKEKKKSGKKIVKHADKMSVEELAQLLRDYRASGMSLDEFCTENELSEEDKLILQALEARSKAHAEELSDTSRKGRR